MRKTLSLWAWLSLSAGCLYAPDAPREVPEGFLVVGHRGAPLARAENTLASVEEAVHLGADALEIDLCVTADRRVVLWHDPDPDSALAIARQAGVEGLRYMPSVPARGLPWRRRVAGLTLAELRATHGYSQSAWGRPAPEAPIATWEEFADFVARTPSLRAVLLDLKQPDANAYATIRAAVEATVAPTGPTVYFLSTEGDLLAGLERAIDREAHPNLRTMFDAVGPSGARDAQRAGTRAVALGHTLTRINHRYQDDLDDAMSARDTGALDLVVAWTLDRTDHQRIVLAYGVNGILTNDPRTLRASLAAGPAAPHEVEAWFAGL